MSRTAFRKGVPTLALLILLTACGQARADAPSPTQVPSDAPAPSQPAKPASTPRPAPVATPEPSDEPTGSPVAAPVESPDPAAPVRFKLPMVGHVTANGVAVRSLPDLDAPVIHGEIVGGDGGIVAFLRLDAGTKVAAFVGPVFADGLSWYQVTSAGNGPITFVEGWIAGEFLARDGDLSGHSTHLGTLNGVGTGGSIEAEVQAFSPIMVSFGVNVVEGDDACDFGVDVVMADGRIVPISVGEISEARVGRASAPYVEALYQQEAGTVTLTVVTDCSYALSMDILGG